MRKTISCAAFLLVLSVPLWHGSLPGFFHEEEATACILGALCVLLGVFACLRPKLQQTLSRLDAAVMLFFLYMATHYAVHDGTRTDPYVACKWAAALAGYALARSIPDKNILLHAILGACVLETITALLQTGGIIASSHPLFDVTGHFGNPGPLGGFLAVGWVIALTQLLDKSTEDKRTVAFRLLILALLSTGLVLADSRAAWLSAACGTCCALKLSHLIRFSKRTIGLLACSSAIFLGALYLYRPASAQARIFIWQTSIGLFAEKPLCGWGIGSFHWEYMPRQAHYFETHPSAPELTVADNTGFPYNEILHAALETGAIGLILICAIFFLACRESATDKIRAVALPALAAWLLFAQFSYPSEVFPLLFIATCLLGCLDTPSAAGLPHGKLLPAALLLLWAVTGLGAFRLGHFYHQASSCLSSLHGKHNAAALQFAQTHYERLKNNVVFNVTYHFWLARNSDSSKDRDTAENIIPTSESYCLLGDYYRRIGLPQKAESAYKTAHQMVPTRMKPTYRLWRLYLSQQDTARAILMALRLATQPIKVNNSFTINTRRKARDFLRQRP